MIYVWFVFTFCVLTSVENHNVISITLFSDPLNHSGQIRRNQGSVWYQNWKATRPCCTSVWPRTPGYSRILRPEIHIHKTQSVHSRDSPNGQGDEENTRAVCREEKLKYNKMYKATGGKKLWWLDHWAAGSAGSYRPGLPLPASQPTRRLAGGRSSVGGIHPTGQKYIIQDY